MAKDLTEIIDELKQQIVDDWTKEVDEDKVRKLSDQYFFDLLDLMKDSCAGQNILNGIDRIERISQTYIKADQFYPLMIFNDLTVGKNVVLRILINQMSDDFDISDQIINLAKSCDKLLIDFLNRVQGDKLGKSVLQRISLEETKDLLKNAVNFSNIGLFILNRELQIIYWGKGVKRLYEIDEREVLNRHILESFPVLKKEGIYQKILEVLETGNSVDLISVPHQSLKKGKRHIDFKISPLKDNELNIIGVNVLVNDVTDSKKDEETLKEYERFVTNILEDAAEAIFVLDQNDRIKMWNKQAAKMYGYSADKMIGKHISHIVPNDEESQQEILKINQIVKEKGYVKDWETERITVDGRKLMLRLTRTAIRDEKNNYLGSSVIAHDITEKKRLEQQLIQSEKLSAVGQLAAGIAHEVGSPLTAISSLAQLMYEKSEDEWDRDKLKMIRDQIDRISRIVRELVNFSKPISTTVGEVSVNNVIEEAYQIISYDKRLKHFKFDMQLFPNIPHIQISFDQLLQVLINILLNAGDALENKRDGKISIHSRLVGEKIIISIIDNGVGIPKDKLDHIFEPFYTTKKPGKGTGLGLWVCYNIIQGFAGEIIVESEPDKGTAFHIVLPVFKNLDEQKDE